MRGAQLVNPLADQIIEGTPRASVPIGGLDDHELGEAREGLNFPLRVTPRTRSTPLMFPHPDNAEDTLGRPVRVNVCPIITRPPLVCVSPTCLSLTRISFTARGLTGAF
jgi:hypothetical protein